MPSITIKTERVTDIDRGSSAYENRIEVTLDMSKDQIKEAVDELIGYCTEEDLESWVKEHFPDFRNLEVQL